MRQRAVAGCGVVVLLVSSFFGPRVLFAADSAGRLPLEALAGQVVDPSGKPAAGATVWLVGATPKGGLKTLEETATDAQGRFVFREAKSRYTQPELGIPHLVVRDLRGRLGGDSHPWTWPRWTPRQNLRIRLSDVRDCRGRLLDAAGRPIAKALVRPRSVASVGLEDQGHQDIGLSPELTKDLECETGADGAFTLRRVPGGGSVTATITAAGFGSPQIAWDLKDSVTLRLDRTGSVRGTLVTTSTTAALETLKLRLYVHSIPTKSKAAGFHVSYSATTFPDKDGKFQFDNVPPGDCTIHPDLYTSSLSYYTKDRISVEVKPGETASVEVKLLPAVAVRGQVVDGQSGRGIAGVTVSASIVSDKGYWTSGRQATTDAEGRFVAYTEPGKVAIGVRATPEGYVVPFSDGQPAKMDAVKDLVWPTITLERAARLEGIVVDESGKPVPDAEVQSLVARGQHEHELGILRTDRDGKFAICGLLAKQPLALRARTQSAVSDVAQPRPADATGPVRLTVSMAKAFAIRGLCVDAAGRPVCQAKVGVSSVWMLGPGGIGCGVSSAETDDQGRFEVRALWTGFQYDFSVTAEGYDKFESQRFQAEPGQVHDAGRLTLVSTSGSVEGTVVDSSGRPIAGVRVFNSGDAPKVLSTNTDTSGRFRLEGFRLGPVYVFAEKEGYRFTGVRTQSKATGPRTPLSRGGRGAGDEGLTLQLLRTDQPAAPWRPERPPRPFADQQKVLRRLLEKLWITPSHGKERWAVRTMARIDLEQARKWSAEVGGKYDHDLLWEVVQKTADADLDEALSLLVQEGGVSNTLVGLAQRYVVSDPPKAMRCAEEAVIRARSLDQPQRAMSLARAGSLVVQLGNQPSGHKVIEEAADMAAKMGTDGYPCYVRGLVATALAPHDLSRALDLVERVSDRNEKERALARIATAIASRDLSKALELLGRVEKRSTLPDLARMQIAYQLAPTRRDDAVRVVEGMDSYGATKMKAEAFGWLAVAVAPRDARLAHSLIDKSMAIYWGQAGELRGWSGSGGRTAFAARVVVQAQKIGYPDMGLLVNRVLAMRPTGADGYSPREIQETVIRTARILALVNPECARQVLVSVVPAESTPKGIRAVMEDRDLLQAWALADLDHAVKVIESWVEMSKAGNFWTNYLIETLDLIAAPPEGRAQAMLRHGGYWFPGDEL